ncbi:netrin receptor UNC5B-a-like [Mercenaria mercenaria]|uniref:netrin receptor UNC5B-a-like n=1 Tax=Mercenaria mercenaria TaxID=6596 RepID=UPI00234E47EA|nr:netrin receptor UNC5B-a-like [Mercenaria mercenaria]
METYDTIEPEHRICMENLDKTNPALSEIYEKLQITHPQEDTSKVSKNICMTDRKRKYLVLLCVMTCVVLSLTSLGFTILEKVEAIDGSWSGWAHWEACSSTCDVGMQRRQRNCSNPHPSGNGRQCLGVDNEQRFCYSGPCSKTTTEMTTTMESTSQLPCCEDMYPTYADLLFALEIPETTTTSSTMTPWPPSQYIDSVNNAIEIANCQSCGYDYDGGSGGLFLG